MQMHAVATLLRVTTQRSTGREFHGPLVAFAANSQQHLISKRFKSILFYESSQTTTASITATAPRECAGLRRACIVGAIVVAHVLISCIGAFVRRGNNACRRVCARVCVGVCVRASDCALHLCLPDSLMTRAVSRARHRCAPSRALHRPGAGSCFKGPFYDHM